MKRFVVIFAAGAALTILLGWWMLPAEPQRGRSLRPAVSEPEGGFLPAPPGDDRAPSPTGSARRQPQKHMAALAAPHRPAREPAPRRASTTPRRGPAGRTVASRPPQGPAGGAADEGREDAPVDTADRRVDRVHVRLTPSVVSFETDQPIEVEVEIEGSADVVSSLERVDLTMADPAFHGVSFALTCDRGRGPGRVGTTLLPKSRGLAQGAYRLTSLVLRLEGGGRLAPGPAQIDAEDPLLRVTTDKPPLSLLWARVVPEVVEAGAPVHVEFEVAGADRLQTGTAALRYGPAGEPPGTLINRVRLPKGRIRLRPLARKDQATDYLVVQLMIMTADGRRGIWSGDPLTFTVGPEAPGEPFRVVGMHFEPPVASPGDTVDLVVDVAGGEVDDVPEDMVLFGAARLAVTRDRTETLRMIRRVGQPAYRGRYQIDAALSPGVITLEWLSLPAFDSQFVELDRQAAPELFEGATLTVQ